MIKKNKLKNILLFSAIMCIGSTGLFYVNSYANNSELSVQDQNRLLGAVAMEWESSNLREWLNSDKVNVDYTGIAPSYKDEAGFLTNFTQAEQEAIAITRHGGGWQYSLDSNTNDTLYVSQRGVCHNDYLYNDKVFILHYTDLYNFVERNKDLLNSNKKYFSDYLKNTTNKQDKYPYLVNSGYVNNSYINTNQMYSSTLTTLSGKSQNNIVPALSLKADYVLSNGVKAKDLDVGSIVTFGSYNGEAIEWQVINKSDNGIPLLWSTKIITTKEYDAPGDINPLKSKYINFNNYDVDIASGTGQNKSWETDEAILSTPVITIENESVLTTPTNDTSITIKIKVTDTHNNIRRIILPDGSVVNGATADYVLPKNGEYDIIAENDQGVITVRHIITKAINTPAEVNITTDKEDNNKWTNKPVTVTVKASNNGVYTQIAKGNKNMGYANSNAGVYPNWMPLGGKRFRVTGTFRNVITDDDIVKYGLDMNAKIKIRISMLRYSIDSVGWTYPLFKEISLKELKEKGEIVIDEIYTIPNNAYSNVKPYITFMDRNSPYMKTGYDYWMSDFTFEILDKDDLKIEEIYLPDGNIVKSDTATYTIFKKGSYTFSAKDNRNKITSKTIELDIDMVNPELNISYPTSFTENNITLKVKATDDLSGIKSIKLPNGEYRTNSKDGLPLSIDYNITENGTYKFEALDFAGNKITKTVVINNIDRTPPTLTYTLSPNTWTKDDVTISVKAVDKESGIKEIILPNGSSVKTNTANYTVSNNGVYYFKAYDNLNHVSALKIVVSNIDKNKPSVSISKNPDVEWTNKNVQINISGSDE